MLISLWNDRLMPVSKSCRAETWMPEIKIKKFCSRPSTVVQPCVLFRQLNDATGSHPVFLEAWATLTHRSNDNMFMCGSDRSQDKCCAAHSTNMRWQSELEQFGPWSGTGNTRDGLHLFKNLMRDLQLYIFAQGNHTFAGASVLLNHSVTWSVHCKGESVALVFLKRQPTPRA